MTSIIGIEIKAYQPPNDNTKLMSAMTDLLCISRILVKGSALLELLVNLKDSWTYCNFTETKMTTVVNIRKPKGNKSPYVRNDAALNSEYVVKYMITASVEALNIHSIYDCKLNKDLRLKVYNSGTASKVEAARSFSNIPRKITGSEVNS